MLSGLGYWGFMCSGLGKVVVGSSSGVSRTRFLGLQGFGISSVALETVSRKAWTAQSLMPVHP